jgi:hypothetical protein
MVVFWFARPCGLRTPAFKGNILPMSSDSTLLPNVVIYLQGYTLLPEKPTSTDERHF